MKVSQELKDIIRKKLNREMDLALIAVRDERVAKIGALNNALIESSEMSAYLDARAKLDARIKEAIGDDLSIKINPCYEVITGKVLPHPVVEDHYGPNSIRELYNSKYDSIIVKLSYGKNFDEIKGILTEFGIEI